MAGRYELIETKEFPVDCPQPVFRFVDDTGETRTELLDCFNDEPIVEVNWSEYKQTSDWNNNFQNYTAYSVSFTFQEVDLPSGNKWMIGGGNLEGTFVVPEGSFQASFEQEGNEQVCYISYRTNTGELVKSDSGYRIPYPTIIDFRGEDPSNPDKGFYQEVFFTPVPIIESYTAYPNPDYNPDLAGNDEGRADDEILGKYYFILVEKNRPLSEEQTPLLEGWQNTKGDYDVVCLNICENHCILIQDENGRINCLCDDYREDGTPHYSEDPDDTDIKPSDAPDMPNPNDYPQDDDTEEEKAEKDKQVRELESSDRFSQTDNLGNGFYATYLKKIVEINEGTFETPNWRQKSITLDSVSVASKDDPVKYYETIKSKGFDLYGVEIAMNFKSNNGSTYTYESGTVLWEGDRPSSFVPEKTVGESLPSGDPENPEIQTRSRFTNDLISKNFNGEIYTITPKIEIKEESRDGSNWIEIERILVNATVVAPNKTKWTDEDLTKFESMLSARYAISLVGLEKPSSKFGPNQIEINVTL